MTSEENNTAVSAEIPEAPESTSQDVTCTNCQTTESWEGASWCPQCGYYPAIGRCVEQGNAEQQQAKPWEQQAGEEEVNILKIIPPWIQVLAGGTVGIVVLSIVANQMLGENDSQLLGKNDSYRLLWTLGQCGVGIIFAGVAHFTAFMSGVTTSERLTALDLLTKPVEIWKPTMIALPRTAHCLWMLMWGVTAIVCALTITGGIPYSKLFE